MKIKRAKKSLAALLALLLVCLCSLPALAQDTEVSSEAALATAIQDATGTAQAPSAIKVTGSIAVSQKITIPAGKYVKLSGGSLVRSDGYTGDMIEVSGGLVLADIALDGAAVDGSGVLVSVRNGSLVIEQGAALRNNRNSAVKILASGAVGTNTASCIMNGGVIENNSAAKGAAILFSNSGTMRFEMNGGEIRGNTATSAGGAINESGWSADPTIVINDGVIRDNSVTGSDSVYGGAIYSNGTLLINGGVITGNSIPNGRGGGVYKTYGNTFTFTGGQIYGNTARTTMPAGNNVCMVDGSLVLGGAAYLPDGLILYANNDVKVTLASPLQNRIGFEQVYRGGLGTVVCEGDGTYTPTAADLQKLSYQDNAFGFALRDGIITLSAYPPYHSYDKGMLIAAELTIPAPTYTITIPEKLDMGQLTRKKDDAADKLVSKELTVTASEVDNLFGEKQIVVSASTADGAFSLTDGKNLLPYACYAANSTAPLGSGDKFAVFADNGEQTGRVEVDQSLIRHAGTFTGTLTFTIALEEIV